MTQKAPYKGLGAESEEKREPASDIDTGVVDSLKVLDPDGRLEKRTSIRDLAMSHSCHIRTWRHLPFSFCQRLRNFVRRVDEKPHDRTERAVLQADNSDLHAIKWKFNGQDFDL